ncbi:MAG: sigma-70 family RNA polymerase sigma factor [Puia sp.]|nr:sigma-70 family RNA polymerase sigma factor [Puia sp.]
MLVDPSHNEIWAQLREGNSDALLALYNKYYTGLINYGLRLSGDRVLTNDCITQVLLRLWDKRSELPVVTNPRSYLLSCLRNELFGELRAIHSRVAGGKGFMRATDQEEPSYEEYIIRLQTNKTLKERLMMAMGELSSREKELLQLKFFEDLSYDEIAARCQITKRTAYNIIHAALKILKRNLAGKYSVDPLSYHLMIALVLFVFLQ